MMMNESAMTESQIEQLKKDVMFIGSACNLSIHIENPFTAQVRRILRLMNSLHEKRTDLSLRRDSAACNRLINDIDNVLLLLDSRKYKLLFR